MQAVQSYKANDGRLFENKAECLKHDFNLAVRGFIQTNGPSGKSSMVQVADVGDVISRNFDTFYNLMKRQNQLLVAARPKSEKVS